MDENKSKFAIISCNGVDKKLGCIARELAIEFSNENRDHHLICPVLLNSGDEKYEKALRENEIIAINGCMTRCATKLLDERSLKPKTQVYIPEMIKKIGIKPTKGLSILDQDRDLLKKIIENLQNDLAADPTANTSREFQESPLISGGVYNYKKDKFSFDVPQNGYKFNENDCWVKIEGDIAAIGISDYVQNNLGDIMYVDLPEIGASIDQFDDAGSLESVKTVVDVITPVSGVIIAINHELDPTPELINQDPYQKGWILKLKVSNFEDEQDLLLNSQNYFEHMKKKIDREAEK